MGSKAFAGAFGEAMVFNLPQEPHAAAMKLKGARLFDPSGMGRPMKEWVEVPRTRRASRRRLAEAARAYVARLGIAPALRARVLDAALWER